MVEDYPKLDTRASTKLSQLSDTELFEVLAQGARLCAKNANHLIEDSHYLLVGERPRGGEILQEFAYEEASKAVMLVDIVRCPREKRQFRRFYDHIAKGIYRKCYDMNQTTYGELKAHINNERKSHYWEGDGEAMFLAPNEITTQREQTIYVELIHDDSGYFWNDPSDFDYMSTAWVPPKPSLNRSLEVLQAMEKLGFFSANVLSAVATFWKSISIEDSYDWKWLKSKNTELIDNLRQNDLLICEDKEFSQIIIEMWCFPIFDLELAQEKMQKTLCPRTVGRVEERNPATQASTARRKPESEETR